MSPRRMLLRRALPGVVLALVAVTAAAAKPAPPPAPVVPDEPAVTVEAAAAVLSDGRVPAECAGLAAAATAPELVARAQIECMLAQSYRKDRRAAALALALYRSAGTVAGVGPAEVMDGGYRGMIRLVPQLPTGVHRAHLGHVVDALADFREVFGELARGAPAPLRLRWQNLVVRFVRSVAKRTPSAYAADWTVTYNVRGSLLTSADGVRETMFHELFHLNDQAHGDWSVQALTTDYDAIVARCSPKLTRTCLAPYAPGSTTVRGGTYYAFQQNNGNGVHEYAAELALRYYKEHRELLATGKLARAPFKCGPPENGRAWRALVAEFFGGVDRTPPCA